MPKHCLTGEEFSQAELLSLLNLADTLRAEKIRNGGVSTRKDLAGRTLITLFEKPSLRTHVSFTVAIQELGGYAVESYSSNRKQEEPEDIARVLAGYGHLIMLRTFEQKTVERMAAHSPIPVINGLSDTHHPCQVFADLLTLKQKLGSLKGATLAYVGDGNNILHSLLLLCPFLGVNVHYACPPGFLPDAEITRRAKSRAAEGGGSIQYFVNAKDACQGAHAIYTDVWTSMGFEKEEAAREAAFAGFQVNSDLYSVAAPNASLMHCMPMVKGKEISEEMAAHPNAVFFRQSENRLHAQKALMLSLGVQ
ncbi:MAG: ornithine carbamoyltransferase [Oligoflexia bacterium]|nr:ornithine carbamoyltransferase [Oligoflexia bacterium]